MSTKKPAVYINIKAFTKSIEGMTSEQIGQAWQRFCDRHKDNKEPKLIRGIDE